MKTRWGVVLILAVLMLSTSVSAQSIDLEFIPEQISANSGFILVATPSATDDSIRMNWLVGDTINGYGLFPRTGSTWSCYFSNTDSMSTCGPSPFTESTDDHGIPYELEVTITNATGPMKNVTEDVMVGGIPINPKVNINYSTNTANMIVSILDGKYADSVFYAVYNSDLSPASAGYSPLSIDIASEKWLGSVKLEKRTYYIAFKANNTQDFGGGVVRVSLAEEEQQPEDSDEVEIDDVDVTALVDLGDTYEKGNNLIRNTKNTTITDIYASVPSDLRDYITINFPGNASLGPYESTYYTVIFRNLDSSLSVSTNMPVYSDTGQIATISLKAEISIRGASGGDYSCDGKDDGTDCIGGICCSESCIKKAECCDSTDCVGSCTNYRCSSGSECPTGSECRTGQSTCGNDSYTGSCTGGICCSTSSTSTNECEDAYDGILCNNGICCSGFCMPGAECCSDFDCGSGETCDGYECVGSGGTETPDMTMIIIIIAIVVIGGLGAYIFLKRRSNKQPEEPEEADEEFEEDEFF